MPSKTESNIMAAKLKAQQLKDLYDRVFFNLQDGSVSSREMSGWVVRAKVISVEVKEAVEQGTSRQNAGLLDRVVAVLSGLDKAIERKEAWIASQPIDLSAGIGS
jgi:hypothetical protein